MYGQMYYWDALKQREEAKAMLAKLPVAELHELNNFKNPKRIKAVVARNQIVGTVGKQYRLVQHAEAFKPVLDALDATGQNYNLSIWTSRDMGRSWMTIMTDVEAKDSVKLGFQVGNSIDGTTAIKYGFQSFFGSGYVELVGYRQVCSNGMVVRVPLNEASFVREEVRQQLEKLFEKYVKIRHIGNVEARLEEVGIIVEAMALLKEPIAKMIMTAQNKRVGTETAEELLLQYVGKRYKARILEQYEREEKSLWGLYNAITWVGSHTEELKEGAKSGMIGKAADLLTAEIRASGRRV